MDAVRGAGGGRRLTLVGDFGFPARLEAELAAGLLTPRERLERLAAHELVRRASSGDLDFGNSRASEPSDRALRAVLDRVRAYLDVEPDEEAFLVGALAVGVSKALTDEEPLWLMIVGPPSSGKSEAIHLLDLLADLRVDELTRAGLLSWSTGRGKSKRAGILARIPPHSLVTVTDFSTVVTASDREGRARMFGMLRVVYDGHVYRGIGGEPAGSGDELEWSGHLTLIAGATPAIDSHTSFEAALGERWLTLRLPESDAGRAVARSRYVVDRRDVPTHRRAAQELARDLVLAARGRIPAELEPELTEALVNLAVFVAHARTGVQHEGTGRHRVIVGIPTPEEPTRLVGQLVRFMRCALALGLSTEQALSLTVTLALDSVPLARMRALQAVVDAGEVGASVADVHRALGRGNRWAAIWELDALEAIGLVAVEGPDREESPTAHRLYRLAETYRKVYESVGRPLTSPLRGVGREGQSTGGDRHFRTLSERGVGRGGLAPAREPREAA